MNQALDSSVHTRRMVYRAATCTALPTVLSVARYSTSTSK